MAREDYTSGWLERDRKKQKDGLLLGQRIRGRLPTLRDVLARYQVKEALIFGSFASGAQRSGSDLDLAVSGAHSSDWYRMSAEIERTVGISLDLVDLDLAPPELRGRIRLNGRKIFP